MNKREQMQEKIRRHGEQLQAIFGLDGDPMALLRRLRLRENKARRLATDYCNGVIDMDEYGKEVEIILSSVCEILSREDVTILFDGDPRGTILKIDNDTVRRLGLDITQDMAGYGLIAPSFFS